MSITVMRDVFALAQVFTIARGSRTEAHVITVRIERGGVVGWGECVPYARYGETLDSVTAQIEALAPDISRAALQDALPPGAARNAVDCASWAWEATTAGQPAGDLAGLSTPGPHTTPHTLPLVPP